MESTTGQFPLASAAASVAAAVPSAAASGFGSSFGNTGTVVGFAHCFLSTKICGEGAQPTIPELVRITSQNPLELLPSTSTTSVLKTLMRWSPALSGKSSTYRLSSTRPATAGSGLQGSTVPA